MGAETVPDVYRTPFPPIGCPVQPNMGKVSSFTPTLCLVWLMSLEACLFLKQKEEEWIWGREELEEEELFGEGEAKTVVWM